MTFNRHRDEFPTLASGIHLLSHSLGPVPRAVRESMIAYCDAWEHHTSEDAWATSWWTLSRASAIASRAFSAASRARFRSSQTLRSRWPPSLRVSISKADAKQSRHDGARLPVDGIHLGRATPDRRALRSRSVADGISVPLEKILDAIDDETCLVALAHTSYCSSYRVDARAIVERAHAKGALVLLDVYQSAGVLPLYAADWNVDFLIGGTIKWLCGGPSCGYLYVRPDLQRDLRPRLTGWVAHDSPFDFAHAPMRYARSVRRLRRERRVFPALYSAIPGLDIIEAVGVTQIAAESQRRRS